ncbi:MAG: pectinesterase family protein [Pyrinomonadaceae bacterium]
MIIRNSFSAKGTSFLAFLCFLAAGSAASQTLFPADKAKMVNPDVQLKLTFKDVPTIGKSGKVRVYDASNDKLVDTLDLSIAPGPTKPVDPAIRAKDYLKFAYPYERTSRPTNRDTKPGTGSAGATPTNGIDYQLTIIGGFTDGFHFYPVIVNDKTATIQLHHDLLEYGKTYYAQIDAGVLIVPGFSGIDGKKWTFTTKAKAPKAGAATITVSGDGTGDFNTVQGALDSIPDHSKKRVTVRVKNGLYQEIVYIRNKTNVTIIGESQDKTIVRYANNEVFNPHPANIRTNPEKGTFPSRRAAVTIDNCDGVNVVNMTLQTTAPGQSEGLLIMGDRNILSHVTVIGFGDALQANGRIYMVDSTIDGSGDTILGRGTLFCERCTIRSTSVLMWPRNGKEVHGNVFKDSKFIGTRAPTTIARSPKNGDFEYPYAEVVLLNTELTNIAPEGWGDADKGGNVRFWEYKSHNRDGTPVDVSKRVTWSRQLDPVKDAKLIADYSRPEFVLAGWKPKL